MTLQALIFDVDGTIADTEEVHRQAFNAAFLAMDLGWNWGEAEYMALLRVSGGPERLAHYISGLRVKPGEKQRLAGLVPAIHREKTRLYYELISDGRAVARPGVARLMNEARAAGVKLALAATSTTANVEALVGAVLDPKALGWFGAVASADEVARKKPAPDLYRRIVGTLRVPADACVAIEDSANGVLAAKAAGLYTIATPSRWTATQDFSQADLVQPSLDEPQLDLARIAALHAARATRAA
ncbi:MAG TPA: HAD-IA family hydrolase [Burkholderiales bacterium]|nr:HAD-IA family hydrolase [Burkholderiales bacterium]